MENSEQALDSNRTINDNNASNQEDRSLMSSIFAPHQKLGSCPLAPQASHVRAQNHNQLVMIIESPAKTKTTQNNIARKNLMESIHAPFRLREAHARRISNKIMESSEDNENQQEADDKKVCLSFLRTFFPWCLSLQL